MPSAVKRLERLEPSAAEPRWGSLPPHMRVLYIATHHRTGGWVAEAFAADSASEVELEEAAGLSAGLARVRDEVYDVILLSHEPGELDSLEFLDALGAGGADHPVIVMGEQSEQEMSALCYETGADAYVCVNTVTTRALIWIASRAIERHQLIREHRRLSQAERHRLRLEHNEAHRLLGDLKAVVHDLEEARASGRRGAREGDAVSLPAQLYSHYRDLLRAYVIMGSGNLAKEVFALAELLATVGISAAQTMQLHLTVLEELVAGLGNRSTRHVMTRADLLILEVIVHLAETYRQRYRERKSPPQQMLLPGFESPPTARPHDAAA